jgi:hypothetical protein
LINPVVLGCGKPLSREIGERIDLPLLKTRRLVRGDVVLY